jgi:hypothetical protein
VAHFHQWKPLGKLMLITPIRSSEVAHGIHCGATLR